MDWQRGQAWAGDDATAAYFKELGLDWAGSDDVCCSSGSAFEEVTYRAMDDGNECDEVEAYMYVLE
jgi:hypothetical protein